MSDTQLLENALKLKWFTAEEINKASFGCDDGFLRMSMRTLIAFDHLRGVLGHSLKVTCAFRTREYDIGKERSGYSDHCYGRGMDFAITDLAYALRIVAEASKLGFNSFAINLEEKFVHVGVRDKDRVTTWLY